MEFVIAIIGSVALSYLIGGIPTGYIMARFLIKRDIRSQGSGNVGATNVLRSVGKIPALITLLIDVLKGALVVLLVANFSYKYVDALDPDFYRSLIGFAAIAGHIWPVYLKFKGGKGVATTIGVLGAIMPLPLGMSLLVWLLFFSLTSYVSVGSLAFGLALPSFALAFNRSFYIVLFAIILCCLNIFMHRSNIKRLVKGEENKTHIFKKR